MKKHLLTILLFAPLTGLPQTKRDSVVKYHLTEQQVLTISQLLDYGLKAAGNSSQISTRDYNEFARQVGRIDSVLRIQYQKLHPVKEQPKKP